jgi:superfamily II DNA/RNA helicase
MKKPTKMRRKRRQRMAKKNSGKTEGTKKSIPSGLRSRAWKRFIRGPDPQLLEELYEPGLKEAIRYDRCCAYFSSSVLSAAARGFASLIERLIAMGDAAPRPAVRLVVNEELSEEDVRALTETGDLSALEEQLSRRLKPTQDLLEKKRLEMLGWLVKHDLVQVRVGIIRRGQGILHAKFGIMTDADGDAIVFSGSGNESGQGLMANYERLEVSSSWDDPDRYAEYKTEFEELWSDSHPDVHTLSLPEAIRLKLITFSPPEAPIKEPSVEIPRQKAAMVWQFICEALYLENGASACDSTAMVDPWAHQRYVVEETAASWPSGRLLCDEVGMGKTIEAILVLRRLMAGRGVQRVLFLLPAGLLSQWQTELREKGGLVIPRLEGINTLIWPDDRVERLGGLAEAFQSGALIMSRETARTEQNLSLLLQSPPWDLVVLDEAHAARRKEQEESKVNSATLLLNLLRKLQLRRKTRGILLLSATPMQTHPWEPWDLLAVLGEGDRWLAEFAPVRSYYTALSAVSNGRCRPETASKPASLIASDPRFPPPPDAPSVWRDPEWIGRKMVFHKVTEREKIVHWLRHGSPLMRRMHRNTRATLRQYYDRGFLKSPPPTREVIDEFYDFDSSSERELYNAVSRYIERRFQILENEKPGKGFVMTIYRRRVSSSPYALEKSLERRQDGLRRVIEHHAYDQYLDQEDVDSRDLDDQGDFDAMGKISSALPSDPQNARVELEEVENLLSRLRGRSGQDSKLIRFYDVLRRTMEDGRAVLVFTEYADTMTYLRDNLSAHYGDRTGCYSGDGGQILGGSDWKKVPKTDITKKLQDGELQVLICTDAASEGLNLQAAGAVINYDLPWNPSKVEQRIGRVDRIGQKLPQVRVVNIFLKDSVDENVYRVLRHRCGLFESFVGPMQPVLAKGRNILLGKDPFDAGVLTGIADAIEADPIQSEIYGESAFRDISVAQAPISREEIRGALEHLRGDLGFKVKKNRQDEVYAVSGSGITRTLFASSREALERYPKALPLSPFEMRLADIARALSRSGEQLPLVIGSSQKGAFRSSCAYWLAGEQGETVKSLAELEEMIERWDGTPPSPSLWLQYSEKSRGEAKHIVDAMAREAEKKECDGIEHQLSAARLRLTLELGRYLVCLGNGSTDLSGMLSRLAQRDTQASQRLISVIEKLGGRPSWDSEILRELEEFYGRLNEGQRKGRLMFNELDAALNDPRWEAVERKS